MKGNWHGCEGHSDFWRRGGEVQRRCKMAKTGTVQWFNAMGSSLLMTAVRIASCTLKPSRLQDSTRFVRARRFPDVETGRDGKMSAVNLKAAD